jgi:sugar phosphate isomerase/epimerase
MYSRREFAKLALAGVALPRIGESFAQEAGGVQLGVQTYSFRDLKPAPGGDPVPVIIDAMKAAGFRECELWASRLEPSKDAKNWRVQVPMDHFRGIQKQFQAAGLRIYGYNYSFKREMSDQEIDRGFEMARALGAEIITASTTLDVAQRVVPFAAKHKMVVAMHNHSDLTDPREFATPASFASAMKMSPYFKVNLDIGHFTAANFDAIAYIRENHAAITNLHLKDRKKNQGDTVPWGTGDAPIREVLQLLKKERWPIRAYVEYEYKGTGTPVEESRKCLEYAKEALE